MKPFAVWGHISVPVALHCGGECCVCAAARALLWPCPIPGCPGKLLPVNWEGEQEGVSRRQASTWLSPQLLSLTR